MSGPGSKRQERQSGGTPAKNKRTNTSPVNQYELLDLNTGTETSGHESHQPILNDPIDEHDLLKEDNPLAVAAAADGENDGNGFAEAWDAPEPDHDEYAHLFEEVHTAAEVKPDVMALKKSGDNELVGTLEEEVLVIAVPIEVDPNSRKGKGKGASRVRQSDDLRRGDASKGAYRFALMSVIGMHCEEDVGYEHKSDLPSRTKDGPRGALGVLSFPTKQAKEKFMKATKSTKSSLNGAIGGFTCRYQDPCDEEYDQHVGYEK